MISLIKHNIAINLEESTKILQEKLKRTPSSSFHENSFILISKPETSRVKKNIDSYPP